MINYPNRKKNSNVQGSSQRVQHANRGMKFEHMINESNDFYIAHDKAYIYKNLLPLKL